MDICHCILSAFSADRIKKLSDKQQVIEARELAVTHIQTRNIVLYEYYDMIKYL